MDSLIVIDASGADKSATDVISMTRFHLLFVC